MKFIVNAKDGDVAAGYMTQAEVDNCIREGIDIPFHTRSVWKKHGMLPRKDERGWETKLWRKRLRKGKVSDDLDQYYLVRSVLYHMSQCEPDCIH